MVSEITDKHSYNTYKLKGEQEIHQRLGNRTGGAIHPVAGGAWAVRDLGRGAGTRLTALLGISEGGLLTSTRFTRCRKNSWASCCLLEENSG